MERNSMKRNFGILVIPLALMTIAQSCQQDSRITIERVTGPHNLSEGPHWDVATQLLYFVDIHAQKIMRLDTVTKRVTETYIKNGAVGVAVPVAGTNDTFIAGSGTDLVRIKWDTSRDDLNPEIEILSTVDNGQENTRFNDGKVDPAGRFWAGTMGEKGEQVIDNIATLYRFAADGTPTPIIRPVSISNGLCWSPDNRTFYYIDSPTLEVVAYDFDLPTGDISNKRVIFRLEPINAGEVPDGMTIDKNGNLWIAVHGGGRVIEVDPNTGNIVRCVGFPVTKITSVAFGGPNLDVLYVTSGREGLTTAEIEKQPAAGSVFAVYGLHDIGAPMLDVEIHAEKLIIDTDAGADDATAILLALSAWAAGDSDFEIIAITCVYGNTKEENVERNVLRTLTIANASEIPVYSGIKEPIIGSFDTDDFFGNDGFGDFEFDRELSSSIDKSKHAVMALIELSQKYPRELSVLALGTPTNIASAMILDPEFSQNVNRFYIMGGSVAGEGNKSPGVEFNFGADPMSDFVVLNSTKSQPVLLFPWETVLDSGIPMEWRTGKLGVIDSDTVRFMNQAERKILHEVFWRPSDTMTAAAMIWPQLIKRSLVTNVTPVYDGAAKGILLVDYALQSGKTENAEIVQEFDAEEFKNLLTYYLS